MTIPTGMPMAITSIPATTSLPADQSVAVNNMLSPSYQVRYPSALTTSHGAGSRDGLTRPVAASTLHKTSTDVTEPIPMVRRCDAAGDR